MARIAVVGMWHLGTVSAACLASVGHDIVAIDENAGVIDGLGQGRLPVDEPGLAEMTAQAVAAGRLRFSDQLKDAAGAEMLWITVDTPVDENDRADFEAVHRCALRVLEHAREGATMVISSQMPAGSVARLEREFATVAAGRRVYFACAPENLRLGKAIEVFLRPDRVVLGVRDAATRKVLGAVYQPFCDRIEWMSVESAEMTKHAINAFLATSICFINEIATLCENSGADANEVERGLKTDARIGKLAYLHAGGPIAGGTLARDLGYLRGMAEAERTRVPLIEGVIASNEHHKTWLQRRLAESLGDLRGKTVAILGLTYKVGTNTLRRSSAVETAQWLHGQGAVVKAFDPAISELPVELSGTIELAKDMPDALRGSDALVVATPWPEFQAIDPAAAPALVFDAARFLEKALGARPGFRYFSMGRAN